MSTRKSVKTVWASAVLTGLVVGAGFAPVGVVTGNARVDTTTASLFPLTVKDDLGHSVSLAKQPSRIASVTEGTDEILSALVPKKDVVMVTSYATDPNYSNVAGFAAGIKSITTANAESILSVNPDLVLVASYTDQNVVNQIEQTGVPAYEFNDFNSISDIERNIGVVGKLVGETAKANQVVASMKASLNRTLLAVKGKTKPTVLNFSSYHYVAGRNTTVNDIIVDAGGINAAAKLDGWQKVTDEQVVKLNPDVIIVSSDDAQFAKQLRTSPAFQTVSAVKHHRIYTIKSADLGSVSQYVVRGVADVARVIHPDAAVR